MVACSGYASAMVGQDGTVAMAMRLDAETPGKGGQCLCEKPWNMARTTERNMARTSDRERARYGAHRKPSTPFGGAN